MSVNVPNIKPAELGDPGPHPCGLEHLSIIYVGGPGRGEVLRALFGTFGAHLWPAHEVQEALAFYLFYMPDLVMLDDGGAHEGSSTLAGEVYEHLESVGAAPLLVLASRLQEWQGRLPDSSLVLPSDSSDAALLLAAAELAARHRSAFRARPAALDEGP